MASGKRADSATWVCMYLPHNSRGLDCILQVFFFVLMPLTAGRSSHLESMVFLSGCFDAVLSARVQLTVHFQSGKSKCRKAYTVSRLS